MNTDHTFKKLFEEMKQADIALIPNFQRTLRKRIPEPAVMPSAAWMRLAIAATLILAAILSFNGIQKKHVSREAEQWASLSNWSATTDGILTASISTISDSFSTDSLFDFTPLPATSPTNPNL
jgi:hypothetical protein